MGLTLLAGSANLPLARAIARDLGLPLGDRVLDRFPDGELDIRIGRSVRGEDVYIVQPTSPPIEQHLLELLFLSDACRRAGAGRITAIVPYFGYARQDRRARGREPLGARLVADLMKASGIDRVVALDLHTAAIEGCFGSPLEHLSAVPLLADIVRSWTGVGAVIVSPDLGAVKLAERYARILSLPVAIAHKTRVSGSEVSVRSIVGDVGGRAPIVVDDMISTGGTVEAAVKALLDAGCLPDVAVVATHALLVGQAADRLADLPIRRFVSTDSVQAATSAPLHRETVSLVPLLADAIRRLHVNESLADLLASA